MNFLAPAFLAGPPEITFWHPVAAAAPESGNRPGP
jgi:hypothetical protein